jgi:hypothetical protein
MDPPPPGGISAVIELPPHPNQAEKAALMHNPNPNLSGKGETPGQSWLAG